jgi:hypothetical protein
MNRIATNLLHEQLALARRILSPSIEAQEIQAEEVLRLASVTIELHRKLCTGTPFPSAWLGGTLRAPGEGARRS